MIAPQRPSKSVSGIRNVSVSFAETLDLNELLSGVPIISEVDTTDLTLGNKQISIVDLVINDIKVLAGKAIQFNVNGGVVTNSPYSILITVSSNATPSQTIIGTVILSIVADS